MLINTIGKTELFEDYKTITGATFSEGRKYRYALWRIWDEKMPLVIFIGLNPPNANENQSDNTIRKVTSISRNNGFGGFYMMNLFPFVTKNPKMLKHDQISEELNNEILITISSICTDIVFACGAFDIIIKTGRDKEFIEKFPNAKALFVNKNGSPKHPLYCKNDTQLIKYKW